MTDRPNPKEIAAEQIDWESRKAFCQRRMDQQVHTRAELYCLEAIEALQAAEAREKAMREALDKLNKAVDERRSLSWMEIDAIVRSAPSASKPADGWLDIADAPKDAPKDVAKDVAKMLMGALKEFMDIWGSRDARSESKKAKPREARNRSNRK